MNDRKKFSIALISIIFIATLIGCTCGSNISSTTSISSLTDTSWLLQKYGQPTQLIILPSSTKITLNFRGVGGFDGSTGPNNYGGGCHIEDNQIAIVSLTETTQQDNLGLIYLDLLRQAQTFELVSNELIIHCKNGQELVFEAKI